MRKTIKITYHGNSVTVALVERPLLANDSEYSNSVLSPKARKKVIGEDVSTHSRPKAAGCRQLFTRRPPVVSTHSRPKAAVHRHRHLCIHRAAFQLTAARRRLAKWFLRKSSDTRRFNSQPPEGGWVFRWPQTMPAQCFNSQPPEGGWKNAYVTTGRTIRFNSQPPEGGWKRSAKAIATLLMFQLTAARRRLVFSP